MKDNIISVYSHKSSDFNARSAMAYGSLISGIVLANAGLGIVHGLASSIGGLFNVPHGTVCGTLLAESIKMNVKRLEQIGHDGEHGLMKYAIVGALIAGKDYEVGIDISYYFKEKQMIPNGNLIELKFEDFEENTMNELNRIYSELDISGFKKHFRKIRVLYENDGRKGISFSKNIPPPS